jgi:hypothetical protein
MVLSRRQLLASLVLQQPVPMRAITKGPKFHWFGYYDKLEFDPTGRYVLGNEVDFEGRSPRADDTIRVGMVDLKDNDRWIDLGETRAWNWQQGCMLQWVPGSRSEVLWNDRVDGQFVSHILDVKSGKKRTIPNAVYTLAASGKWGITCDFRRLNDVRPGYGYAGIVDANRDTLIPEDVGIWKVDLTTGKRDLLISVADAARIPYPGGYSENAKHWFNHLLIAPDDQRFIFLHRWRGKKEGTSFSTRMFTADAGGKNLHVLDPYGKTSHFVWRDKDSVIAWAWHPSQGDRFYLYRDRTDQVEVVGDGVMTVNGHCTYLPKRGNRWVLNDTYPDKDRKQNVYVFDTRTGVRTPLGSLFSPKEYSGEWRCDTHPRSSPDGQSVVVDSPHAGGRQMYLFDIRGL